MFRKNNVKTPLFINDNRSADNNTLFSFSKKNRLSTKHSDSQNNIRVVSTKQSESQIKNSGNKLEIEQIPLSRSSIKKVHSFLSFYL